MSNVKDFEMSYSDDIIYLQELREAYLTHHFLGKGGDKFLFDPSCCRMLSIFIVGNIEMLAKAWYERVGIEALNDLTKDTVGNRNKIKVLKKMLDDYDIYSEDHILEKYLAIKSLRNAVIHSDLDTSKKSTLNRNNLPSNIQKLNEANWDLFLEVNTKMMCYLNQIGVYNEQFSEETKRLLINQRAPMVLFEVLEKIKTLGENKFTTSRLYQDNSPRKVPSFMRKKDLVYILWNNILDICDYIVKSEEQKIDYISLTEEVLTNWELYISAVYVEYKNISIEDMLGAINIVKDYAKMDNAIYEEPGDKLYDSFKQVRIMNKVIKDYTILGPFILLLKNTNSEKRHTLLNEIQKIILAMELKRCYDFIEKDYQLDGEFLKKYDEIFNNIGNDF